LSKPLTRKTTNAPNTKIFDLTLPLDQAAEGYEPMDKRRGSKVLLRL
jgi:threonine dehydrogenase-like Zn-dependent dehydrogenase